MEIKIPPTGPEKLNLEVSQKLICIAKVRNLAEIAPNIGFTEFDFYDLYRSTFEKSELGRIKRLLPLREMAENFGMVSKSLRPKLGRRSYFTPEGKVALMFLKMYTGLSCPKLMEQLNGNIHYQMFCDVIIDPTRPLTNYKLLDDIMMELAGKLKIQQQQDLLAEMWKPYMKDLETMYTDATCYESEMRYPTDPKLLWEGIQKLYRIMCEFSSRLNLHRPRTKYLDVQKANLAYRKQRRRTKSQTRKMTRRLLDLLGKILKEIRRMERENDEADKSLTIREKGDLDIITKMYRQQKNHFRSKDCRESIKDRIVSISKPNGIQTSFVKRGRPFSEKKKEKDLVRQEVARVRATAMEGSFGTQKEHYDLKRVKARTKQTEILYIFFGIHTANVVQLEKRIEQRALLEAA